MSCRGVYFALAEDDAMKLLEAKGDDAVLSIIQEDIEKRWDEEGHRQGGQAYLLLINRRS
jgi:hypothetical protein